MAQMCVFFNFQVGMYFFPLLTFLIICSKLAKTFIIYVLLRQITTNAIIERIVIYLQTITPKCRYLISRLVLKAVSHSS